LTVLCSEIRFFAKPQNVIAYTTKPTTLTSNERFNNKRKFTQKWILETKSNFLVKEL